MNNENKMERILEIIKIIVIPISVAIAGYFANEIISSRATEVEYVKLGISILQAENTSFNTQNQNSLREWAVELVDKNAPIPLTKNLKEDLSKGNKNFPFQHQLHLQPFSYLEGIDLSGLNLTNKDFSNSNLFAAKLIDSNLSGSKFMNAIIIQAVLERADLSNANFEYADLSESRLNNAKLIKANMKNATLTGVSLDGADLLECDLRGAKGLSCAQLKKAINWQYTFRDDHLACNKPILKK